MGSKECYKKFPLFYHVSFLLTQSQKSKGHPSSQPHSLLPFPREPGCLSLTPAEALKLLESVCFSISIELVLARNPLSSGLNQSDAPRQIPPSLANDDLVSFIESLEDSPPFLLCPTFH